MKTNPKQKNSPANHENLVARSKQGVVRRSLRLGRARWGLGLSLFVLLIAVVGPFMTPHSPSEFVGQPYSGPSADAWFGTDNLGRDALSRFLAGGPSILVMSILATALGLVVGSGIGLLAAYSRGLLDEILMRAVDVVLAFPQVLLVLVAVTTVGPKPWLVVLMVGLSHAARVSRVIRGGSVGIVESEYVQAEEVVGMPRWRIITKVVLPNISTLLMVEAGIRLTYSVALIAVIGFLGFGLQPPAADWGLMINENRTGFTLQPWTVALPIAAIALLTVGTNLITDAISRTNLGLDERNKS